MDYEYAWKSEKRRKQETWATFAFILLSVLLGLGALRVFGTDPSELGRTSGADIRSYYQR